MTLWRMSQVVGTFAIRDSDLLPHPTQAGKFVVLAPASIAQPGKPWLSVLPDGSVDVSADTGEYQTATRVDDSKVAFTCPTQYPTGAIAFPLLKGL